MKIQKNESLYPETLYPLVLDAGGEDVYLMDWARNNKAYIEKSLNRYGSLHFRNTGLSDLGQFAQLVEILYPNVYRNYGDLPSRSGSSMLYGATPYPAPLTIHFHNEASHTNNWPFRQFFYCVKAAQEGGELRVVDGRVVLKSLPRNLVNTFSEKGLIYIRNFVPYYDVSWQDFYKVSDKRMLEKHLVDNAIEYEWKGEVLQTRQYAPAVITHPRTQEYVWFNQIQLHHPCMLDPDIYVGLKTALKNEDCFPRYVALGDRTPISNIDIEAISNALDTNAVNIRSEPGDIILNDNILVAHSRLPYKGEREVCVALAEPMRGLSR